MFGSKRASIPDCEDVGQPKQQRINILDNFTIDESWDIHTILGLNVKPQPQESVQSSTTKKEPGLLTQLCDLIDSGLTQNDSISTPVMPITQAAETIIVEDDEPEPPQPDLPTLKKISAQITMGMPKKKRLSLALPERNRVHPNETRRITQPIASTIVGNGQLTVQPTISRIEEIDQPTARPTATTSQRIVPPTVRPTASRSKGKDLSMAFRVAQASVDEDSDFEEQESTFKIIADAKRRFKKLKTKHQTQEDKLRSEYAAVELELKKIEETKSRLEDKKKKLEEEISLSETEGRRIDEKMEKLSA